ncbi:hypothetical protein [Sphingomonas sp. 2378]|uniref:hypothetical protein n=1 Tax=Sphingomonas sp. 2378 TaxID=1219748 RepID=UPI00311B108C
MVQDQAGFEDYRELTTLIETGLEALATARALLNRLDERPGPSLRPRRSALPRSMFASNPPAVSKTIEQDRRRSAAMERLVALQPRIGRNGAAVLLRLLDEPGVYVACEELVRAAAIRTTDIKAVKVYICHLRCALRMMGIPAHSIQTGRRSYRLAPDGAVAIRSLLGDDEKFD